MGRSGKNPTRLRCSCGVSFTLAASFMLGPTYCPKCRKKVEVDRGLSPETKKAIAEVARAFTPEEVRRMRLAQEEARKVREAFFAEEARKRRELLARTRGEQQDEAHD